jgi:hypothetical protein
MGWEVSGREIYWRSRTTSLFCRKTEKIRAPQYGRCSGRDLNPAPPKYKVKVLPFDHGVAIIIFVLLFDTLFILASVTSR